MAYAHLTIGEFNELMVNIKSYPPLIRRLIADFDRACEREYKQGIIIDRHRLNQEVKDLK